MESVLRPERSLWWERFVKKVGSWKDKVTNVDVLQRVNESRSLFDNIWRRKLSWLGRVLGYDGLLKDTLEGKMTGRPVRGRKRLNILSMKKESTWHSKEELETGKGGRN